MIFPKVKSDYYLSFLKSFSGFLLPQGRVQVLLQLKIFIGWASAYISTLLIQYLIHFIDVC